MTTRERETEDVVHRSIGEFVDEQNYDLGDDIVTEAYTSHHPATPGSESGPDPRVRSMKGLQRPFPDAGVHIGERLADGESVSFGGTMTGTHQGEFRGIEPTNTSLEVRGTAMHRVRDCRTAETWATWDIPGLLTQIGVVEPRESEL